MRRDADLLATLADGSGLRHSRNAVIPGRQIVPGTGLVVEADRPDSTVFEWTESIGDESQEVGLLRNAFPFPEFRAGSRETYVTSPDLTDEDDRIGARRDS